MKFKSSFATAFCAFGIIATTALGIASPAEARPGGSHGERFKEHNWMEDCNDEEVPEPGTILGLSLAVGGMVVSAKNRHNKLQDNSQGD